MIDPITEDDMAIDERADEEAREQRWAEFIEAMKRRAPGNYWADVLMDVYLSYNSLKTRGWSSDEDLSSFVETEGWPGVFSALARAISEQERTQDAGQEP